MHRKFARFIAILALLLPVILGAQNPPAPAAAGQTPGAQRGGRGGPAAPANVPLGGFNDARHQTFVEIAKKGNIDLLIGLHGDMVTFQNENLISPINDVANQVKNLPPSLVKIGKLGTQNQFYLPHSQATYVMVANKDVLKYMPKGADMNALTYGQVFAWAKAIRKGTGQSRFGLPASSTGLIHRFLQGFLVPSFSGGFVTNFRSKEAAQGWLYLRQLWQYTHPQSLTYGFMQDPLLNEEVLLAWDHVARLKTALDQRPDDLVAFPVPRGPKGRAYMPVLVGMAIPRNAPNPAGAKALMQHMLSLSAQAQILSIAGFFPVVPGRLSKSISPGLRAEAAAVGRQQRANDAVQALLPIGIGAEGGNFNKVYTDTSGGVPTIVEWVDAMLNSASGAPDPGWTNVECTDCGVLLPGDPRPNPLEPPFEQVGSDVVVMCAASPTGAFVDAPAAECRQ